MTIINLSFSLLPTCAAGHEDEFYGDLSDEDLGQQFEGAQLPPAFPGLAMAGSLIELNCHAWLPGLPGIYIALIFTIYDIDNI